MTSDQVKSLGHNLTQSGRSPQNGLPVGPFSGVVDDMFLEVFLRNDSVVQINAHADNLSVPSANDLERNVISNLGPPDNIIKETATVKRWSWVDQDVKIAFENGEGTCPADSRHIKLQLVYGPFVESNVDPSLPPGVVPLLLAWDKRQWNRPDSDAIAPSIPRRWSGVELGMEPWQVRSLYPQMEHERLSANEVVEQTPTAEPSWRELSVFLWKDKAWRICHSRRVAMPGLVSEPSLPVLVRQFGTPDLCCSFDTDESFATWSDGLTYLEQTISPMQQRAGEGPYREVTWALEDSVSRRAKKEFDCSSHSHYDHNELKTFF